MSTLVNNTPTLSCVEPNPSIPGCQIEVGVYCCVSDQSGDKRFTCDICAVWYNTCELKDLLEAASNINFSYQEARNATLTRFNAIQHAAPYNGRKRFPKEVLYTRASGEMLNHLKQVRTSLSYRSVVNVWLEKYPNLKIPDSMLIDDIKQYNQSHVGYREALTALKRAINNCDHTYDRIMFEKHYAVKWVSGDPDCIAEVRDMSFIRPKACCTFHDFRTQLVGTGRNVLINTNDPYNYQTFNVPETRYLDIQSVNSTYMLPTSGFYVYSRTRPNTRDVLRVTYDQDCVITMTPVVSYGSHPNHTAPLPSSLLEEIEEEVEYNE